MSVNIKKNVIFMTRGDTLRTKIQIFDSDGNEYIPSGTDKIRFALKRDYNDEEPLIYKDIDLDTMELHLEPQDTKEFEQPSDYVYDIQLTLSNGDIITFISSKLKIVEEVE